MAAIVIASNSSRPMTPCSQVANQSGVSMPWASSFTSSPLQNDLPSPLTITTCTSLCCARYSVALTRSFTRPSWPHYVPPGGSCANEPALHLPRKAWFPVPNLLSSSLPPVHILRKSTIRLSLPPSLRGIVPGGASRTCTVKPNESLIVC